MNSIASLAVSPNFSDKSLEYKIALYVICSYAHSLLQGCIRRLVKHVSSLDGHEVRAERNVSRS